MNSKPNAPATQRNRDAILHVLRREYAKCSSVLEIGSGTGQHAVYFANQLPHLRWQPSDRSENLPGIRSWVQEAQCNNLMDPIALDVLTPVVPDEKFDGVFSANTAHIMSMDAVRAMFQLVANVLPAGGRFVLYGPFNLKGKHTSDSNRHFDESLRAQDPAMGIRDLGELDVIANNRGLLSFRRYSMPANNMISVWIHE